MKNIVIGTVLALMLAVTAYAKDVTYKACTADNKPVVLAVTLNDQVIAQRPEVDATIRTAFTNAAAALSAEALQSNVGFEAFVDGLDEISWLAIEEVVAPIVLSGTCN